MRTKYIGEIGNTAIFDRDLAISRERYNVRGSDTEG